MFVEGSSFYQFLQLVAISEMCQCYHTRHETEEREKEKIVFAPGETCKLGALYIASWTIFVVIAGDDGERLGMFGKFKVGLNFHFMSIFCNLIFFLNKIKMIDYHEFSVKFMLLI